MSCCISSQFAWPNLLLDPFPYLKVTPPIPSLTPSWWQKITCCFLWWNLKGSRNEVPRSLDFDEIFVRRRMIPEKHRRMVSWDGRKFLYKNSKKWGIFCCSSKVDLDMSNWLVEVNIDPTPSDVSSRTKGCPGLNVPSKSGNFGCPSVNNLLDHHYFVCGSWMSDSQGLITGWSVWSFTTDTLW